MPFTPEGKRRPWTPEELAQLQAKRAPTAPLPASTAPKPSEPAPFAKAAKALAARLAEIQPASEVPELPEPTPASFGALRQVEAPTGPEETFLERVGDRIKELYEGTREVGQYLVSGASGSLRVPQLARSAAKHNVTGAEGVLPPQEVTGSPDYGNLNPAYFGIKPVEEARHIPQWVAEMATGAGEVAPYVLGGAVLGTLGAGAEAVGGEGAAKLLTKVAPRLARARAGQALTGLVGPAVRVGAEMAAVTAGQKLADLATQDRPITGLDLAGAGKEIAGGFLAGAGLGVAGRVAGEPVRKVLGRSLGGATTSGIEGAVRRGTVAATGGAATGATLAVLNTGFQALAHPGQFNAGQATSTALRETAFFGLLDAVMSAMQGSVPKAGAFKFRPGEAPVPVGAGGPRREGYTEVRPGVWLKADPATGRPAEAIVEPARYGDWRTREAAEPGASATAGVESELGRRVDEVVGDIAPPAGLSVELVGGPGPRQTEDGFAFSNPEIEARYQAAHGVRAPGLGAKARELLGSLYRKATREYEWLPHTPEFAPLRFNLLRLSKQKGVAGDRTLRLQQGITIGLKGDPKGFSLFERKVLLDDLAEEAEAGHDLPFGFNREVLAADKARLDAEAAKNPAIGEAVAQRRQVWEAIKGDYIEAMQAVGFDVADRFTRENYFRHQVLEYANVRGLSGTGGKLRTPTGRGFLRQREGSAYDINTNYLQAEHEVMAQMLYDIEVAKVIKFVGDRYNIAPLLKAEGTDWRKSIPAGYTAWQPGEGNTFYFADSVPARVAERLYSGALKEIGVGADELRRVLALGQRFPEMVVKEEVAKTLDNLTRSRPADPIRDVARGLLTRWKIWQLINPLRFLKYNFNNLSGDADAVFAGNPSTFKKAPQAASELYRVFAGDGAMSDEMREWFNRGGMQSTLQVQELGDINQLRMFQDLLDQKGSWREVPTRVWQAYWKKARLSTDFREAILRYAAYLDYLEQMQGRGGRPRNFGASIPSEIMALDDIRDRAFWLSNDLLGAYDKVSVLGQGLREYWYPFWSWKEINFKRYVQLIKNAAWDEGLARVTAAKLVPVLARRSPVIALRVGAFALRAAGLVALLSAWNHLRYPDEEERLPADVRDRPHLILGTDAKGNIRYTDRLGALPDFLQWFGLESPRALVRDYLNGHKSVAQVAVEMAKAPVNVLVQGFGPQKTLVEVVTGKRLYPDLFEPGPVRNAGLHIAQSLSLGDVYSRLKGLPTRPFDPGSLLHKVADPGEAAYYDILDAKQEFLKSKGKPGGYRGSVSPTSQALYYLKLAARYGDREAFGKYLLEFANLGGSAKGLGTSLRNLNSLDGLTAPEAQEFITRWLDAEGRQRLATAERFYKETLLGNTARFFQEAVRKRSARP